MNHMDRLRILSCFLNVKAPDGNLPAGIRKFRLEKEDLRVIRFDTLIAPWVKDEIRIRLFQIGFLAVRGGRR